MGEDLYSMPDAGRMRPSAAGNHSILHHQDITGISEGYRCGTRVDFSCTQRDIQTKKNNSSPRASLKTEELNPGYLVVDFVDTDRIAEAFFASSQDLYSFVKSYPYERPKELEQKVEYYTEIILNHHSRLKITEVWQTDGNINYPLIYNMP